MKMNHVYKICHGIAPDYLSAHFTCITSIHSYSTRGSPYNFIVPRIKGQASHTFFHTTIRHWNFLPNSIKETNYLSHFKTAVKKYLSEQARLAEQNPSHHNDYWALFIFCCFSHMFFLFGLLFLIWFWFCPCLPLWCCYFCHIRTPMELSLFEKGFLGYPWYSWALFHKR